MSHKKILGAFSIMVYVLTVVLAAPSGLAADSFSDVDGSYRYFNAIEYLKKEGIAQGYKDNTFRPIKPITRAEFLKLTILATRQKPESGNCYKDVRKSNWHSGYVCKAKKLGWVEGYRDKTFKPWQKINFAEASKIVVKAFNIEKKPPVPNESWYKTYVTALENQQAIPFDVASFHRPLHRGQAAEMIWRVNTKPRYAQTITYKTIERRMLAAETDGNLLTFKSCPELQDYLQDVSKINSYGSYYGVEELVEADEASDGTQSSEFQTQKGNERYSETNVQVEGVDEADIVKTDGEYIYVIKKTNKSTETRGVRVIKAYPPQDLAEAPAEVTFDSKNFYPEEMYVDGDRLVVIGSGNVSFDSMEGYYADSATLVYIFDIQDKNNIKLSRKLTFEGNYSSSRKIDNILYMIMNKNEYRDTVDEESDDQKIVPLYKDSNSTAVSGIVECDDVMYSPISESINYVIVAGIPIEDSDSEISKQVVLGSSGTVYASRENLYMAEEQAYWFYSMGNQNEETTVHKFSLGAPTISYRGKNSVPGHILNQFSMDESNGYFRIATTKGDVWNQAVPSTNNLYILDQNLNIVGRLENIAPGEKIYSVRFMGKKAYMVTFKKVDPLFVIDVSEPSSPKILGELKIPGYSDYLHPLDENHIIGFGKDAVEAAASDKQSRNLDFAWYQGIKIALFDVTDATNPIELHKTMIGDRGTESPLLYNHKALMFDRDTNVMAFPVTVSEIPAEQKNDPNTPAFTYGERVYQGAYVYQVTVENGFEFKGRITHYDNDELQNPVAEDDSFAGQYYGGYQHKNIERILYIGDYLYTVSNAMVMANSIHDLAEVNKVVFP